MRIGKRTTVSLSVDHALICICRLPDAGAEQIEFFSRTKFSTQTKIHGMTINSCDRAMGHGFTHINVVNGISSIKSAITAWLAQSVERETLRFHFLRKRLIQSQGCGFDPRIGLVFLAMRGSFFVLW
jgi:hypothetical protein